MQLVLPLSPGCGGLFTTPSGNIFSPNYPETYPHNTNCEWNITVAEYQTVQITFKEFDLEDSANCTYDYIMVSLSASASRLWSRPTLATAVTHLSDICSFTTDYQQTLPS